MSKFLYEIEIIDTNGWVTGDGCKDEIVVERSWMSTQSYEDETCDGRRKTED